MGAGDLAAQTEQAYSNVAAALRAAGATTADLTRVTVYVVDLDVEKAREVLECRRRAAEQLGVEFQHPGTFVGVTALFDPAYLVEVEATAIAERPQPVAAGTAATDVDIQAALPDGPRTGDRRCSAVSIARPSSCSSHGDRCGSSRRS